MKAGTKGTSLWPEAIAGNKSSMRTNSHYPSTQSLQ